MPGGLALLTQLLRLRAMRRAPRGWGWMGKRPVPDNVMDAWFRLARTNPAIRRDLAKCVVFVPARSVLLQWAQRSASFERPVLVAWATENRVMSPEHGRRLAVLFPKVQLAEIDDSYTLIPEDQPDVLAQHLRAFLTRQ